MCQNTWTNFQPLAASEKKDIIRKIMTLRQTAHIPEQLHNKSLQTDYRKIKVFVCEQTENRLLKLQTNSSQNNLRQMTANITHDCIWILNVDKHMRILQSKHLQCTIPYPVS